ncbi:lactonase family protein [Terriglobus tenax]|uniref:lactonase family protein n=1 Tax=Terriglobus tenax TaxID=1111115 RepID=UPI0021E0EF6B|nr:lactonase family protein [Terriglobus tenax]
MKLSLSGRLLLACVVSLSLIAGMTACGGGTVGFMWVLGTQFNQVDGFKIDNFTGNLTKIVHAPFSAGGTNPVSIVVRPGGRWVYVINKGVLPTSTTAATAGSISIYSVGGDGVLSYQLNQSSQGTNPIWAQIDSTGNYLYVLDALSNQADQSQFVGTGVGAITVFAISGTTGRLTLVQNQQTKCTTAACNGQQLNYFPVGANPTMSKFFSSGYLFTLNAGDSTTSPSVTAYQQNSTNGQLTLVTNSTTQIGSVGTKISSITSNGTYVYLTDVTNNQIYAYTVNSGALQPVTGSPFPNLSPATTPVWTLVDSGGKFLYVLNQGTTSVQTVSSSISAFVIDTQGRLSRLADSSNPYPVGSGPVCMVQDPTNQYVYTSNQNDSTVTGFIINRNTGQLSGLTRGSTFPTVGNPTCLVVSGNTR